MKIAKTALCPYGFGMCLGRGVSRVGSGIESLVLPHGKEMLGKRWAAFLVSEHKLITGLFLDEMHPSVKDQPGAVGLSVDILSQDSREFCRAFPSLHETPPLPAALMGWGAAVSKAKKVAALESQIHAPAWPRLLRKF